MSRKLSTKILNTIIQKNVKPYYKSLMHSRVATVMYITPELLIKSNPDLKLVDPKITQEIIKRYLAYTNEGLIPLSERSKYPTKSMFKLSDTTGNSAAIVSLPKTIIRKGKAPTQRNTHTPVLKYFRDVTKRIDAELLEFEDINLGDNLVPASIGKVNIPIGNTSRIDKKLTQLENVGINYNIEFNKNFKKQLATQSIDYIITIPQHHTISERALGDLLEGRILGEVQNLANNGDLFEIASSRSFMQYLSDLAKSVFLDKKVPKEKSSKHIRGGISTKQRFKQIYSKVGSKLKNLKKIKQPAVTGVTLLPIINELLPQRVRHYMGDSNDPAIKLRNQTGRFSESVEAIGITSTRAGATNIIYTFMRDPYGTFLPGGNLYTPERDPSGFIPLAIRDIAISLIGSRFKVTSELI